MFFIYGAVLAADGIEHVAGEKLYARLRGKAAHAPAGERVPKFTKGPELSVVPVHNEAMIISAKRRRTQGGYVLPNGFSGPEIERRAFYRGDPAGRYEIIIHFNIGRAEQPRLGRQDIGTPVVSGEIEIRVIREVDGAGGV